MNNIILLYSDNNKFRLLNVESNNYFILSKVESEFQINRNELINNNEAISLTPYK